MGDINTVATISKHKLESMDKKKRRYFRLSGDEQLMFETAKKYLSDDGIISDVSERVNSRALVEIISFFIEEYADKRSEINQNIISNKLDDIVSRLDNIDKYNKNKSLTNRLKSLDVNQTAIQSEMKSLASQVSHSSRYVETTISSNIKDINTDIVNEIRNSCNSINRNNSKTHIYINDLRTTMSEVQMHNESYITEISRVLNISLVNLKESITRIVSKHTDNVLYTLKSNIFTQLVEMNQMNLYLLHSIWVSIKENIDDKSLKAVDIQSKKGVFDMLLNFRDKMKNFKDVPSFETGEDRMEIRANNVIRKNKEDAMKLMDEMKNGDGNA